MLRAHCLPAITGKGKGASGDGTLEITGDALAPGFPRRRSYYQRTLPIASHAWQKKTQNAHSDCKVIFEVLGTKRTAKLEEWARAVGAPASRRTDTHSSMFIHTARSLAVSCTFFMRYGGSLACTHEFTAQIHRRLKQDST